jgi:chemotaxis protein MotB
MGQRSKLKSDFEIPDSQSAKEKNTLGHSKILLHPKRLRAEEKLGLLERYKIKHEKPNDESESNWLVSYADMMTLMVGFFVMLQSFSKTDAARFEQVKRSATKIFGGEYHMPYEKLTKKVKQVINQQNLNSQVLFTESDDGVIVSFRGALFFSSGSYELNKEALDLLEKLIPTIGENGKEMGIVVEGYTDNRPATGNKSFSNWELSSLRACAVLKLFEAKGFNRDKLRAQGFGDTHPVVPNEDDKGVSLPDNQAQNRRVVIKILRSFDE